MAAFVSGFFLYILRDPFTFRVRYVGITTQGGKRLLQHILEYDPKNREKSDWIQALLDQGHYPLTTVHHFSSMWELQEWEILFIDFFLRFGDRLFNKTPGGELKEKFQPRPAQPGTTWYSYREDMLPELRARLKAGNVDPPVAAREIYNFITEALPNFGDPLKKFFSKTLDDMVKNGCVPQSPAQLPEKPVAVVQLVAPPEGLQEPAPTVASRKSRKKPKVAKDPAFVCGNSACQTPDSPKHSRLKKENPNGPVLCNACYSVGLRARYDRENRDRLGRPKVTPVPDQ